MSACLRRNVSGAGHAEYRRPARWRKSAKAVIRLEAMWRSWEQARPRPRHRHQHLAPRPRRLPPQRSDEPHRTLHTLHRHRRMERTPAVRSAATGAFPRCSGLSRRFRMLFVVTDSVPMSNRWIARRGLREYFEHGPDLRRPRSANSLSPTFSCFQGLHHLGTNSLASVRSCWWACAVTPGPAPSSDQTHWSKRTCSPEP